MVYRSNALPAKGDNANIIKPVSGPIFGVLVHKSAVTVATFYPAFVRGNLKPHARVAQWAFTAITGNPVAVHDFDFRGFDFHERLILLVVVD
jgi:hypothetical protein